MNLIDIYNKLHRSINLRLITSSTLTHKVASYLEKLKVFQHQDTEVFDPNDQTSHIPPESLEEDTGNGDQNHANYLDDNLPTIPKEEQEEEQQYSDTVSFNDEQEYSDNEHFNTTMDTAAEDSQITMGKPTPTPFITDLVCVPTEKVGSSHVTHKLQQFLEDYPPKTEEHAFEAILEF